MTVYHGSSVIIKKPDIGHSYRPLDFWKGFYVTTIREQAEKWAKSKQDILGSEKAIDQLAFITQKAIDKLLIFRTFEEVK